MKKIYLSLLLLLAGYNNYAATWYANSGDATNVNSWWSDVAFTGTHPADFNTPGDVWVMEGNLNTSAAWIISGTLVLDNATFNPYFNVTIGGDLTMSHTSVFTGNNLIDVNLFGNLSVNDQASWDNPPAYTQIHFVNSASSLGAPQSISWTSTGSGEYTGIVIEAGVTVQLISNVVLPMFDDIAETINGTLVGGSYSLYASGNALATGFGSSIYSGHTGGIDSTLQAASYTFDPGTNFIFNGSAAQVTGVNLPMSIFTGGSVTINNPSGVSLSNSTVFEAGSVLALTAGSLTLGSSSVVLDGASSLAGTFSAAAMIVTDGAGMVYRRVSADGTYFFPLGDVSGNYSPVNMDLTATAYGPTATLAASVKNAKQSANRNLTDYLNRYWTAMVNDMTAPMYSFNATYVPADVIGTEANLSSAAYTGTLPWMKYAPVDVTTHMISAGPIAATNGISTDATAISTALPSLTLTPDAAVCIGSSVTLSVVTVERDSPFTYSWMPADGLSSTAGSSVVATPTVTTTYTVTVTDANGFTGMAMTTVTVNAYPNVYNVTGGGSYCAGGTGVNVGVDMSDTGVNYAVYYGGVMTGSAVAGTGSMLTLGSETMSGTYTVTATGAHTGCISNMSGSATVSITPLVMPTVSITSTMGDTLCSGSMTTLTTTYTHGGTAPSFHWTKNGSNVGTDSMNFSTVPADGNVFVVKLISNEACATPDSVMDTLVISVLPNGTPAVTIAAAAGDTVCDGSSVTLTATPSFGGNSPSYVWVKNTIPVSASSSYSFMPANGDHVYAILTSNYRCRLSNTAYSNVADLDVLDPIVPSVTIAATRGLFIATGTPDTLVATVMNGGLAPHYQWYLNNVAVPAATSNTFYRSSFTNNDSISCLVTRNDACALSTINSVVIKVRPVGTEVITAAGVEIALTPNPNTGNFRLAGTLPTAASQEVNLSVTNVLGQVVYHNAVTVYNGQIDVQVAAGNIANGMYILSVQAGSDSRAFRFVVEK